MTDFNINPTQVMTVVEDIAATTKALNDELDQMGADLRTGLSQWEGSAVVAYEHHKATWDAAADRMTVNLENARAALTQINEAYDRTETANANTWGSV
ncbi:MAG: WXG100 family type VII secretion target [Actinomycetota bacterium]